MSGVCDSDVVCASRCCHAVYLSLVVRLLLAVHRPDGVRPHIGGNRQQLRSSLALGVAGVALQFDRQRHLQRTTPFAHRAWAHEADTDLLI